MELSAIIECHDMHSVGKPLDEDGHPAVRWTPLGAADRSETDTDESAINLDYCSESKIQNFPEEHDVLNTSLLSMTSHFAQVLFRLEQVLHAESENKESLLRELEQFAWKGVPDLHILRQADEGGEGNNEQAGQRIYVPLIINQLKTQLDDLEQFAYKNGELCHPPTLSVLEKQQILLNELGQRLGLDLDELRAVPESEIRDKIDLAITQLTNPIKTKEALVDQLKTQIVDLERFINFLHDEEGSDATIIKALQSFKQYQKEQLAGAQQLHPPGPTKVGAIGVAHSPSIGGNGGFQIGLSRRQKPAYAENEKADNFVHDRKFTDGSSEDAFSRPSQNIGDHRAVNVLTRALTVLHLFATGSVGRGGSTIAKSGHKCTSIRSGYNSEKAEQAKIQHWGDLRAELELVISSVLEKASRLRSLRTREDHRRQSGLENNCSQGHPPGAPICLSPEHRRLHVDTEYSGEIQNGKRNHGSNKETGVEPVPIITYTESHNEAVAEAHQALNAAVRRQLCPALEALIEHGLRIPAARTVSQTVGLNDKSSGVLERWGLGCFSRRNHNSHLRDHSPDDYDYDEADDEEDSDNSEQEYELSYRKRRQNGRRHSWASAWSIFLKFYVMKNGRAFNDTPARKLSESFALDIIGGTVITSKQQLLSSMGTILQLFNKYKRSDECQFRALIYMALNSHKLVAWLKLVLRNPLIVQYMYQPWSYVLSTGFDDALQSLNKLTNIDFNIPFDANIRHLRDIQDVF